MKRLLSVITIFLASILILSGCNFQKKKFTILQQHPPEEPIILSVLVWDNFGQAL